METTEKATQGTFTFTNDFQNWKDEFKNSQKFNAIFNNVKDTTGKVKSRIVDITKKVMEMEIIKKISDYISNHPVIAIVTLWILAIIIMGSLLMGSITGGVVFAIYLTVYTIAYILAYYLAVGFVGMGVIAVHNFVSKVKKTD